MFLVELVLQGVLGIRELVRLRFQGGFNFIAAGNESGKTTSVAAIQRLLFPSNQPPLMDALLSRHTPDSSRAALVALSDSRAYFRIIQDFSKKAVNVSQYNAAKKEFNLLHKDWEHAMEFMAGLTSGVSEGDFEKVFILRRDHYSDLRETPRPAPAAVRTAAPDAKPAGKSSAVEAKLAALRDMLVKAEEAADAEYHAQSARLALDEMEKKLAEFEEIDAKKGEMDAALEELKGCETLPEDVAELVEAQEQREGRKNVEADQLKKELDSLNLHIEKFPSVNFFKDKLFLAGALVGACSMVAGIGFTVRAEIFMGGVVASLALIAAAWYNGSRKSAQRKALQKEASDLEKDIADIEKRFEQEGASVTACMKATGAGSLEELKEKSHRYRQFANLQGELEERRRRVLGGAAPEALREERDKLQQEALELESKAQAVAQYNVDTYSIRQDIDRLEGELSSVESSWGGLDAPFQEAPAVFAAPAEKEAEYGIHAELRIAARIGEIEMETLLPAVEAAAQRNLSAVTGGKYIRIEAGHDGGPPVLHTKDNAAVNFGDLSHGTRDLLYFCLRTGLVEALVGKRRLPFLLDDPLAAFDPERQKAACQILRSLGAKTQVILFSSNPALRAAGDAAAELK
jgi:uncharacterized protein YhaN